MFLHVSVIHSVHRGVSQHAMGQQYIGSCTSVESQLVWRQHTGNIKCMMGQVTWYTPTDTPPGADNPLGADAPWSRHPPGSRHLLGADTPLGADPLGADTPWEQTPPGADTSWEQTPPWEQTPSPGSGHPPGADTPLPPRADTPGHCAGGTHPTGMHSCVIKELTF